MPLPPSPTLADIRAEIDRIDEAVHGLLMERGAVIDTLIEVKKTGESGSAFRPGREADVVRRLVERHHGRLPKAIMVSLWRQIISAFTHIQAPHKVHAGSDGALPAVRELALAHFGFSVPLISEENPDAVIASIKGARGDLGFIGIEGSVGPWWRGLGGSEGPVVMASAPVTEDDSGKIRALIIAASLTDHNGLDKQVIAFRVASSLPDSQAILAQVVHKGSVEVLAWGDSEVDPSVLAQQLGGKEVEQVQALGYTASPLKV